MRVLILRFSALGDIALTVPVIRNIEQNNPDAELVIVSRSFARSLFQPLTATFHAGDFSGIHKGLPGLYRLFRELMEKYQPDLVIDLHNVLRTRLLKMFFNTKGIPVYTIDKGRREKKGLTRQKNKIRKPLRHTTQRYAEVFERAGLTVDFSPADNPKLDYRGKIPAGIAEKMLSEKWIGIAPFASYKGKMWPLAKMQELINILWQEGHKILLFGGPAEKQDLENLVENRKNITNIAGISGLNDELEVMRNLNVMVAMDSSNMHLAVLAGIPVVSIWGATHSFAGFGPLGSNDVWKVEIPLDNLKCRPCSIFGNRPCYRADYACLNWIEPKDVKEKIDFVLLNQTKR